MGNLTISLARANVCVKRPGLEPVDEPGSLGRALKT